MKKTILPIIILLFFINCNKNKEDTDIDYSSFLNSTVPSFSGEKDGVSFNWEFSWSTFHNSYGMVNGPLEQYNIDENERIIFYSLHEQNNNILYLPDFCTNEETYSVINGIDISTPKFNFLTDDLLNSVLNIGKKNIGTFENGFNFTVYVNSKKYCPGEYFEGIEILKTEMVAENEAQYIYVWLVLDDIVLVSNEEESSIYLSNGKIIAKFRLYTD